MGINHINIITLGYEQNYILKDFILRIDPGFPIWDMVCIQKTHEQNFGNRDQS